MADSDRLAQKETTLGDAAVDGLLAGGGAGVLMAAYLILAGLAMGEGLTTILGRFDPGGTASPVVGALTHLAVSGIYGALFGMGWWIVPRGWRGRWTGLGAGLVYGLALFGMAVSVLLPATTSPLSEIPALHFAVAHALYGLALGWLLAARSRQ